MSVLETQWPSRTTIHRVNDGGGALHDGSPRERSPIAKGNTVWISELKNLDEVRSFLLSQINYDESNGFSFVQIATKVELQKVADLLGKPGTFNTETEQQQIMIYNAAVDHPTEGKRDHHQLDVYFWAFHHEPLVMIVIHFDYYKYGLFTEPFYAFIKDLFLSFIDKLGAPDKKSFRRTKERLEYHRGKHTFLMWSNTEGLRIQIR